ncbi:MAG: elongation factor P [Alphaproteobacteria bacterium]|nr:elongation factor P [Alphaproteobacteria bacterium]MDA7987399.1 elongation factor P [Alphaproteobacteria bacterium]MDA7988557.1 elongation factor P [Alphaproteobacteria bacterium]MDA7999953.1 elongation factor P [Alphaproteobacteria bacterium]MDA8003821.1 elongation factor P [Alphaproteobacteria bacterium]
MRIQGNAVKPGNILLHQNKLWRVVKIQHVKPGKGGAFNQVELKNIPDGTKLNERFRSDDLIEKVRLDEQKYQYLYTADDLLTLMHSENFEQITVSAGLLGDARKFLAEMMELTVESYEGKPIAVSLPESVTLAVSETEPVVKGQTATSSYKPALLENGVRTMVPPHIEAGQRIVVNTQNGEYMERARN